jgi:hypothetical protein
MVKAVGEIEVCYIVGGSKNRKALAAHILAGLADPDLLDEAESVTVEFWQRRPYTACKLFYRNGDRWIQDYGFTKVCYPDTWDPEYGRRLAAKKAAHAVARQVAHRLEVRLRS